MLVIRLPAEPSRHRVAVWRELRKAGALLLGHGTWAIPGRTRLRAGGAAGGRSS
ncbi:Chromate resistance protein ChrB [Saccharopolyspora erythraea]|uniref:Chromate resistance protein ChrB n=1 Tax=Saccharopolyspora erythraea TaxID=1836 RepID=UPI0002D9EBF9|nr:Chromate resistance protein ChrB [Saccharopolyspora erythraea]QRK87660.1 hypothetical protein JQX30_23110 [Saccharopolyspora erythraea]